MADFSSLNFLKKPLFFIPAVLIILILALLALNYFYFPQAPTKGKALHPEEPIILPTPTPVKSSTPSSQKQR